MSKYPYTPLTGKIPNYFGKIQETGVPGKFDREHLKRLGFKSGNDTYFIRILKFLGFLGEDGAPTDRWVQYRDKSKSKMVMAEAIRESYEDLYEIYPQAHRESEDTLLNFFKTDDPRLEESTIRRIVKTFKSLCELADFGTEAKLVTPKVTAPTSTSAVAEEVSVLEALKLPEIHVNIQIHIPETENSKVYEELFRAMRKHLLTRKEE